MRKRLFAAAVALLLAPVPGLTQPATVTPTQPPGSPARLIERCAMLLGAYEDAEKQKSQLFVSSVTPRAEAGPPNAPRRMDPQAAILVETMNQSVVMQMLIAYQCELPASPPSASRYIRNAAECNTAATTKREDAARLCSRENWRPDAPEVRGPATTTGSAG